MSRRHISRVAALLAGLPAIAALVLLVGVGPAAATSCSGGLTPDFLLTQLITTAGGSVAYDLTVTNTGTCAATNVTVTVQLPSSSSFRGFSGVSGNWRCASDLTITNQVDCSLSTLAQTSTQSSGSDGTAEVVVNATAVTSGNKNSPPDVTDYAFVSDEGQVVSTITGPAPLGPGPYDADDAVWGGAVNPKTGGSVTTGFSSFEPNLNSTVNVPSGVVGTVGVTQQVFDTHDSLCTSTSPPPASCTADIELHAPPITNGYNTIVMKALGPNQPPPPLYDEGSGINTMLSCKGQTASPPCLYSIKGFSLNTNNPYYLITIHDSSGTLIWH